MGIKLYRYRTFKKNWKEEAFDGIVEPSSPLYFNDPYDCDFCFQEDISDEIHERKDYVEMVKKYIPLRKEEQDRILYADDLERALRMVFWAHGKSIQGSVKAFLRNDMSEMTNELRDAVRVVCLSETYDSMLMWGHYAMNHAENKNIWSKMKEKLHKYSFLGCLLLAGIVFFTWTDNWQVYTEPLQETYTKGVLLAEQLVEGKWPGISGEQSDATGSVSGNVPGENVKTGDTVSDGNQTDQTMGTVQSPATGEEAAMPETTGTETQDPAATVPVEEIPQEVVYHTVDDSYFDDAVFIGDSRTVGMYEYGGLEETSTFYASTGLTVYKMFDSAIVSVPGQKKKITVEEALSEKQFAKIYLMIGINEMGTGTVESFMKAYGEAVQHLQELQPDAVIYLQAIMKVTTERSEQGDYITNEGIGARNAEIAELADDQKIFFLDVNPLICDETGGMVASYTYDGVHLKAQYIPIWLDFLKEHAVE